MDESLAEPAEDQGHRLSRDRRRRRLRAERDLAEALAFRKAMEDSLVTGLRARDMDGRITYVNPAFCQMVGLSAEQLLGIGVQAGTRAYDLGIDVRYLNRSRRWNWGVAAELRPLVRTRSVGELVDLDGRRALAQDTELRLQTSTRFGGLTASRRQMSAA